MTSVGKYLMYNTVNGVIIGRIYDFSGNRYAVDFDKEEHTGTYVHKDSVIAIEDSQEELRLKYPEYFI